jgi:HrpA-like RNA helicase
MNPLNNKKFSENYYKIKKITSKFPINKESEKFIDKLIKNNIVILISGTGSGKSVSAPIIALKYYNYKRQIILTQPRTVNIISISQFISDQLDTQLGNEVGYMYGAGKKYDKNKNKILVIIDSIYHKISKLFNLEEETDEEPPIIFVDEIHERSIYMDLILTSAYILFKEKKNHEKLPKFVLLSATIDPNFFKSYYEKVCKVDIVKIPGVSQKIEHVYKNFKINNPYPLIIKEVQNLLKKKENYKDILIFLPTLSSCIKMVKEIEKKKYDNLFITVLSRKTEEKEKIFITDGNLYKIENAWKKYFGYEDPFNRSKIFNRRVICSTPIAETGLTIKGIKYVIDSGLVNTVFINPKDGKKYQKITKINKQSVIQRCGRTGRTEPGICIHMYTHEQFKIMHESLLPQIYKTNYNTLIINFIKIYESISKAIFRIKYMPNRLNQKLQASSINSLYVNGLLFEDYLSKKGEIATNLGIDIDLGNLIISSFEYNIHKYMIPIVVFIHIDPNPFSWTSGDIKKNEYGTPIVFLIFWHKFLSTFLNNNYKLIKNEKYKNPLKKWCDKMKFDYYKFDKFIITLNKLEKRLHEYKGFLIKKIKFTQIPIPDLIILMFIKYFKHRLIKISQNKYKLNNTIIYFKPKIISGDPLIISFIDIIYTQYGPPLIISPFTVVKKNIELN